MSNEQPSDYKRSWCVQSNEGSAGWHDICKNPSGDVILYYSVEDAMAAIDKCPDTGTYRIVRWK